MATLEQIIDEARSLSAAEKQKLRQALDLELERQKPFDATPPVQSDNGDDETRKRRLEWLKSHREEYGGQYVALHGERLVGSGETIRDAATAAKENGCLQPFLVYVPRPEGEYWGGWL